MAGGGPEYDRPDDMAQTLKELHDLVDGLYQNYLGDDFVPQEEVDSARALLDNLPTDVQHARDCIQATLDEYEVANVSFAGTQMKVTFNDNTIKYVDYIEMEDIEFAIQRAIDAKENK